MARDVYAACPCGSGKKLKFCCQAIAGEMEKVAKMREAGQTRTAMQALDSLEKKHHGNAWIATMRALLLFDDERFAEAKAALDSLLESDPDHLFALVLAATAALSADGYEPSKKLVHRAFQRCPLAFPSFVSNLALAIAAMMHAEDHELATRQHLVLAMRMAREEDRQDVFVRLLEFDGDAQMPYPLRSVHELVSLDDCADLAEEAEKAERFSAVGCWDSAANIYEKLTERAPENPRLWNNLALCRAWDGQDVSASKAFRRAGALYEDRDDAVECETLAQLTEEIPDDYVVRTVQRRYRVESVAKLLGLLDEVPRLIRAPLSEEHRSAGVAAAYEWIDRDHPDNVEALDLDSTPRVLGRITVLSENNRTGEGAELFVAAREGETSQRANDVVTAAAGDLLELLPQEGDGDDVVLSVPAQYFPVTEPFNFTKRTPADLASRIQRRRWQRFIDEEWVNSPIGSLDGNTPLEASQVPELSVRLEAAVYVFDAFLDSHRYVLDINSLRERLGLAPEAPVAVDESTMLGAFTAMQLNRLPVRDLTDEQLKYVLNRALLIHHGRFLDEVLLEVLDRPSCRDNVDLNRVYETLTGLAHDRGDIESAVRWTQKGFELAAASDEPFRNELQWKMRELMVRLDEPSDPELEPLLLRLWNHYGKKVPQLRDQLRSILPAWNVEPPWGDERDVVLPESGSESRSGVWTPGSPSQPEAERKLWLPGQE